MTLYAQVRDGAILRAGTAPTQPGWEDGRWWEFDQPAVVTAYLRDYGWVQVVEVAKPADTADTRYAERIELVAGVPTQTWQAVAKTQAEKDAEAAVANEATMRDWLAARYVDNVADDKALSDYIDGITVLTTAVALKSIARVVRSLIRQVARIERLLLRRLDGTD